MELKVPKMASAPNLTPLIDIVFLLLVFFLLTTQFLEEEGVDVHLPGASLEAAELKAPVVVTLALDGRIFVAGQPVASEALGAELAARCGRSSTVVIRADRETYLQRTVTVMEEARRAGAARIMIATLDANP